MKKHPGLILCLVTSLFGVQSGSCLTLAGNLASKNPAVVKKARAQYLALTSEKKKRFLESLSHNLRSDFPGTKIKAARALGNIGAEKDAILILLQYPHDSDSIEVKHAIGQAYVAMGPAAIPPLLGCVGTDDYLAQVIANTGKPGMRSLTEVIEDPFIIDKFFGNPLDHDRLSNYRERAVGALEYCKPNAVEALPTLISLVKKGIHVRAMFPLLEKMGPSAEQIVPYLSSGFLKSREDFLFFKDSVTAVLKAIGTPEALHAIKKIEGDEKKLIEFERVQHESKMKKFESDVNGGKIESLTIEQIDELANYNFEKLKNIGKKVNAVSWNTFTGETERKGQAELGKMLLMDGEVADFDYLHNETVITLTRSDVLSPFICSFPGKLTRDDFIGKHGRYRLVLVGRYDGILTLGSNLNPTRCGKIRIFAILLGPRLFVSRKM